MSRAGLLAIEVIQTLFRVFPFPCPTGLVRIGNPTRDSPVLLTCNFRLTVERVWRALRSGFRFDSLTIHPDVASGPKTSRSSAPLAWVSSYMGVGARWE